MWISKIFEKGFASIKSDYRTWLIIAVITGALTLPVVLLVPNEGEVINAGVAGYAASALSFILNILIAPGLIAIGLSAARGKKLELDLIVKKVHLAGKLFGFSILYGIAVVAGLLALIIPGIYLMVRFGFAPLIMVENEKIGVFDAMKKSGEMAKGHYFDIIFSIFTVFLVALFFLMIASLIVEFAFPGVAVGPTLIREALYVFPNSVTTPLVYVGFSIIYLSLAKTK